MSSNRPIGILDSGFGGLSVARAIRAAIPNEDLVFAADCAYAPYGDNSSEYIQARLEHVVSFLLAQQVKALVFACNTATAVGIRAFRARLSMPIIGIEPAVFPALRHTRTGHIGVLATCRTIESQKYADVRHRAIEWAEVSRPMPVTVWDVPCPGLMECVERGDFDSAMSIRSRPTMSTRSYSAALTIPSSRTPLPSTHRKRRSSIRHPLSLSSSSADWRRSILPHPKLLPALSASLPQALTPPERRCFAHSGLILVSVCTKWTKGAASGADLEKFRLTLNHIRSKSFADFGRDTPRDKLIV